MDYDLVQAKNGSPSAEKPLLHAPPRTRPDEAKTVVRLMERLLLVALSVTVRTAAVKHKFAGGVSIQFNLAGWRLSLRGVKRRSNLIGGTVPRKSRDCRSSVTADSDHGSCTARFSNRPN